MTEAGIDSFRYSGIDPLVAIGCTDDADILLDEAALLLAAADLHQTDGEPLDDELLDEAIAGPMAAMAELATHLPTDVIDNADRGAALAELLHGQEGFEGDRDNYDAAENADLLRVWKRRRGMPVALSIIYVALARRVGWDAHPLGTPGHVLVMLGSGGASAMIDPFEGGVPVSRADLAAIIQRTLGSQPIQPHHAVPLGNREVLVRLVMNQASRLLARDEEAQALVLFRRLTAIAPAMSGLWWERARVERRMGDLAAARASLAAMLEITRDPSLRGRIMAAADAAR